MWLFSIDTLPPQEGFVAMDGQHDSEERAWTSCSPGTIQDLVQRLQAAQRRRTAFRRGRLLTIVVLLTTGAWASNRFLGYRDQHPVSLSCAEVQGNLEAFRAGKLPKSISEKIAMHLETCDSCRAHWQSLDLHVWRWWLPNTQLGGRPQDAKERNPLSSGHVCDRSRKCYSLSAKGRGICRSSPS